MCKGPVEGAQLVCGRKEASMAGPGVGKMGHEGRGKTGALL